MPTPADPPPATAPHERVVTLFQRRFDARPDVVVRAPGRATLLGAHVDHCEGWVLPMAIERAVYVAAGRRTGRELELVAADLEESARLRLDRLPPPVPRRGDAAPAGWADYPAGVAWALGEAGHRLSGMRAVIGGDLPMAAGLSSSAALESALVLALEELSALTLEPAERALVGHRAEAGYLGLGSGIMDQFVILHAEPGGALLVDCRSLAHESIPLPAGVRLVVADSGRRRRLVGSRFNRRQRDCRRAAELLRRELPSIGTLRDVTPTELERLAKGLPEPLERRARHVVGECDRVRRGAAALRRGDVAELGRLMRRSHESSRDLYEVSLPELDTLAEAAWRTPGCLGARFSGGGFGGCVGALVERGAQAEVAAAMEGAFESRFGGRPRFFVSAAAGAARALDRGPSAGRRGGC